MTDMNSKMGNITKLYNYEAENAVNGAILIDGRSAYIALEILTPEHFASEQQRIIFEAIAELYSRGEAIDLVTVHELTKSKIKIEALTEITEKIYSSTNLQTHARLVAECWMRRELLGLCTKTMQGAEASDDIFETLSKTESELMRIGQYAFQKRYEPIRQPVKEAIEIMEAIKYGNSEFALPTGFLDIDSLIGGFRKKDLIIIAARPSMGKSALMLNIAANQAAKGNIGIFSIEMSSVKLAFRQIARECGVSSSDMMRGQIRNEDLAKVSRGAYRAGKLNIFIDDSAGLTTMEFRTKARRMKAEKNVQAIYVDYLQQMRHPAQNREREISEISATLKAVAKELDIPVIALSQLNRSVEMANDKKPNLSHLRDSGSIEQDADLVMFLYRPEYYGYKDYKSYDGELHQAEGLTVLPIAKSRDGATGEVLLRFNAGLTEFNNYSKFLI